MDSRISATEASPADWFASGKRSKMEFSSVSFEGLTLNLKDIYEGLSKSYANSGDYRNAFKYQSLFSNFKDTMYNIANDKKLGSLQFDFDLQKKEGQISLLTKDKALQDAELRSQKLAKNAFAAGLGLVMLIAVLIFRNYREKVKTNKILDYQKVQIENLLLNILPAEVAKELQLYGQASPIVLIFSKLYFPMI